MVRMVYRVRNQCLFCLGYSWFTVYLMVYRVPLNLYVNLLFKTEDIPPSYAMKYPLLYTFYYSISKLPGIAFCYTSHSCK